MAKEREYYYGLGRRKEATAQVRLYPDGGQWQINGLPADEYFKRDVDHSTMRQPLEATATLEKFRVSVLVSGGGISGQAGAIRLGIARALMAYDPNLRLALRQRGLLSRDPRIKERKKPGLKRARKAPQYTKR